MSSSIKITELPSQGETKYPKVETQPIVEESTEGTFEPNVQVQNDHIRNFVNNFHRNDVEFHYEDEEIDYYDTLGEYAYSKNASVDDNILELLTQNKVVQKDSPGELILKAVDNYLPTLKPVKFSMTASNLVSDLELLFPKVPIKIVRGTSKGREVFIPTICDLQIFNSDSLGKFDEKCKRISNKSILKESEIRCEEWYKNMLEEITKALEIYTSALPLTKGIISHNKELQICPNFSFTVEPKEDYMFMTNYRYPSYGVNLKLEGKNFDVIKDSDDDTDYSEKGITIFEYDELLKMEEKYPTVSSTSYMSEGGSPKKYLWDSEIKCSNQKIIDWKNNYLEKKYTDYCYEGLFSTNEEKIKISIINKTDETIYIPKGTEVARYTF